MNLLDLLEPISSETRAGADLVYSAQFSALNHIRRRPEKTRQDWNEIAERCHRLLHGESKDLRLVVWLIEAGLHAKGIDFLGRGLSLLDDFTALFWHDAYPLVADADFDARLAPYEWFGDNLPALVSSLVLVRNRDERPISYADFCNAQRLEVVIRRNPASAEKSLARGALRTADIEQLFKRQDPTQLLNLADDLAQSRHILAGLAKRLDGHLGRDAPSFSQAMRTLEEMSAFLRHQGDRCASGEVPKPTSPQSASEPNAADPAPHIAERAQAVSDLQGLAGIWREREPYSPIPYLLELAGRWAEMDSETVMAEMAGLHREMPEILRTIGWPHVGSTTPDLSSSFSP